MQPPILGKCYIFCLMGTFELNVVKDKSWTPTCWMENAHHIIHTPTSDHLICLSISNLHFLTGLLLCASVSANLFIKNYNYDRNGIRWSPHLFSGQSASVWSPVRVPFPTRVGCIESQSWLKSRVLFFALFLPLWRISSSSLDHGGVGGILRWAEPQLWQMMASRIAQDLPHWFRKAGVGQQLALVLQTTISSLA